MDWRAVMLVAVGGALGAAARHGAGLAALRMMGPGWPAGTFFVNVSGGFAMGLLIGWLVAAEPAGARDWRLFLGVGVLGGFTTFSAFALETALMVERREIAGAAAYASASVVGATAALFAGLALARRLAA